MAELGKLVYQANPCLLYFEERQNSLLLLWNFPVNLLYFHQILPYFSVGSSNRPCLRCSDLFIALRQTGLFLAASRQTHGHTDGTNLYPQTLMLGRSLNVTSSEIPFAFVNKCTWLISISTMWEGNIERMVFLS